MRLPSVLHRPDHQRQQHDRTERHLPTGREQNDQQKKKRENVPETERQIFRKRIPHALDIVDDRGHHAPGRMVLKEADGLPDDFCIHLIPEIGDAGNPRILHQHVAKKFRDPFADKHSQNGDREQCPDAVNLVREERSSGKSAWCVNGISDQEESGIGSAGIQHAVKDGRDHQRDQPFRQSNQRKAHNAQPQAASCTA